MAKPWRWISADIGIAADLPFGPDFTAARQSTPSHGVATPKGQTRLLFCEWIKQRRRTSRDL